MVLDIGGPAECSIEFYEGDGEREVLRDLLRVNLLETK